MVRWAGMGFCPPPWHPAMAAARFGAIRAYRCRCFGLGDREQAEVRSEHDHQQHLSDVARGDESTIMKHLAPDVGD